MLDAYYSYYIYFNKVYTYKVSVKSIVNAFATYGGVKENNV